MGAPIVSPWIGACLVFLALHAAAILLDPTGSGLFNGPFLIAAPLIGLLAIRRLARGTGSTLRIAWLLLGLGLAIWCLAAIASTWADRVEGISPFVVDLPDFLFLCYGIAVMAALALPDRPGLVRRLGWIDVAQGLLAAFLCYVAVFSTVPLAHQIAPPISSRRMINLFSVENLALLAIAALRVLGRSVSPGRAAFDRAALLFLLLYAVSANTYNNYALRTGFMPGLALLLLDLPFLCLLLPRPAGADPENAEVRERRPLTLLVDGATPALFTLLLLWLSWSLIDRRFVAGAVGMALALGLMVARSAITESHHLQAQDALALARDRLLRLSLHDDLTGVSNRRAFQGALSERWGDPANSDSPLALLLIDIDHFKAINDRLGHESGDACLRMVATVLERTLGDDNGALFRYGGEEFAVLLPGATMERAHRIAERLRTAVFLLAIPNRTPTGDRVTISIGIALGRCGEGPASRLIAASDRALYEAKASGRNRICCDGELGAPPGIDPA